MSWEWSSDGKSLTMPLVKGIKWSDGQPFSADDVMFTWNDIILDPGVVKAWTKRSAWQIDGKETWWQAARAGLAQSIEDGRERAGVANLGRNPTFGEAARTHALKVIIEA